VPGPEDGLGLNEKLLGDKGPNANCHKLQP
jgi:hypothetical protein